MMGVCRASHLIRLLYDVDSHSYARLERRIDAKTREHLLLTLRAPRSVVVSLPRHSEFDRRSLPGAVIPTSYNCNCSTPLPHPHAENGLLVCASADAPRLCSSKTADEEPRTSQLPRVPLAVVALLAVCMPVCPAQRPGFACRSRALLLLSASTGISRLPPRTHYCRSRSRTYRTCPAPR